jgi:hypothetical protein
MGVYNNECAIATTYCHIPDEPASDLIKLREWISEQEPYIQQLFSEVPGICNGCLTIVFAPNGSKKGWTDAQICDEIRCNFTQLLDSFAYEDGSNSWHWVEVGFGEIHGQKILNGNNHQA